MRAHQRVLDRVLSEDAQITLGETLLRLFGAERLLGRDVTAPVLSLMGEPDDLREVLRRTRSLHTWVLAWRDVARSHLEVASADAPAAARLRRLRLATAALAFANQAHSDRTVYEEVSAELVAVHERLHGLTRPVYETVEVRAGDATVPALLRVPVEPERPVPVVVLLQGLERSKEQAFHLEDVLCRRGFATLAVDQPGVGAALARGVTIGGANSVDAFGGGLRAAIEADARLDPAQVFLFGFSLGGACALAIVSQMRARATVTLGAPVQLDPARLGVTARRRARFAAGAGTDAEVAALFAEVALQDRIAAIETPILALHGGADPVVPARDAARIARAAAAVTEVRIFPGGDHSCTQYASAVWALVSDRFAAVTVPR